MNCPEVYYKFLTENQWRTQGGGGRNPPTSPLNDKKEKEKGRKRRGKGKKKEKGEKKEKRKEKEKEEKKRIK